MPIDNKRIENEIRPMAVGRKNWLFAGSLAAGQRLATLLSLLETARQNGLEPFVWLRDVLTQTAIFISQDTTLGIPITMNSTVDLGLFNGNRVEKNFFASLLWLSTDPKVDPFTPSANIDETFK
ncbi:MAG: IS66 family transposase [Serratia symbiotica]|nr:IS66 family transposase [Serratia symbiotica]